MKINEIAAYEIEKGWRYDVLFGKGLANHLPMALTALERMGGNGTIIKDFSSIYCSKLQPMRDISTDGFSGFEKHLGKREYFSNYLEFFKNELQINGIKHVLNTYLDKLFSGVAASAFHPLIRLAYALEIDSEQEVAISLAFWSSEYQFSGDILSPNKSSAYTIFNKFKDRFKNFVPHQGIIAGKIFEMSRHPDFKMDEIQPYKIDLSIIALFAVKLYITSGDFILLHGVTASHALRIVLPFVMNQDHALRYFWIALIAGILISDFGEITESRLPEGGMSEKNRINKAIKTILNSKDDHTIKIVYSCWQEFLHYGYHEHISGMERRSFI